MLVQHHSYIPFMYATELLPIKEGNRATGHGRQKVSKKRRKEGGTAVEQNSREIGEDWKAKKDVSEQDTQTDRRTTK